jgi:hypothetical protein
MSANSSTIDFSGMSCQIEGLPETQFLVVNINGKNEVVEIPRVECIDGIWREESECVSVLTSSRCSVSGGQSHWYGIRPDFYYVDIEEGLDSLLENEEIRFIDSIQRYADSDLLSYCERADVWEFTDLCTFFEGDYYRDCDDHLETDGNGNLFLSGDDDYVYCDGEGNYYHIDLCHECEGDWVYGEESDCESCQRCDEEHVQPYHSHRVPVIVHSGISGFAVGFEVEKTSTHNRASSEGDYVGTSPLFAYWETDSSCGVEGITHAYDPCDGIQTSRFERDLKESADWVNSPCDSKCGGHINISSINHSSRDLMIEFKKFAPLFYAMYRNRLNNHYCGADKKIEHGQEKYSPVRTRSFGIEIRLPSRVENESQLLRRFHLIGRTCNAITEGSSFNRYIQDNRGLLLNGFYRGDRKKYAKVIRLARSFRVWFLDGIANESIQRYV